MKTPTAIFAMLLLLIASSTGAQTAGPGSLALVGGTIYIDPSAPPIQNGTVVIREGVIVAVGPKRAVRVPNDISVLDCTGRTVTAGFWNSHVHFLERKWMDAAAIPAEDLTKQLQLMLTQYGFTSVFDVWSNFDNTKLIRSRIESGEIAGPRIRTTGEALQPKKGAPPSFGLGLLGFGPVEVKAIEDAAGAQAAATKLLEGGADGIKVYAMTFAPRVPMPEDAMQVAFAEAHRRGKPTFAHPTSSEALLAAVRAGVDVIVHTTPQSPVWDAAVMAPMKEKNVALIPTLKLWHSELKHDRVSQQRLRVDTGVAQLRAWNSFGGTTLFGTDVGYMDDYNTAMEFDLMAKAGMTYRQILASLTTAPAAKFGDETRLGQIKTGFVGDIVVLRGDPAQSIEVFASPSYTIRDGKVIYAAEGVSTAAR